MSPNEFWRFPAVVIALAGLILVTCLPVLLEVASPTPRVCTAVKGEEVSPSKTSFPSLWAAPAEPKIVPQGLLQSRHSPVDPTPDLVSAHLGGDLSCRAPPTLL